MNKPGKVEYCCRNEVNRKATFILILAVSALRAIVLLIPRQGDNEKNNYFYLLLSIGLGIDLLILHSGILRSWAKTRIADGIIHSDFATRSWRPSRK